MSVWLLALGVDTFTVEKGDTFSIFVRERGAGLYVLSVSQRDGAVLTSGDSIKTFALGDGVLKIWVSENPMMRETKFINIGTHGEVMVECFYDPSPTTHNIGRGGWMAYSQYLPGGENYVVIAIAKQESITLKVFDPTGSSIGERVGKLILFPMRAYVFGNYTFIIKGQPGEKHLLAVLRVFPNFYLYSGGRRWK